MHTPSTRHVRGSRRPPVGALALLAPLLLVAAAAALSAAPARALPPGFVDELVTGGIGAPTALAVAPDGRVFVTEQTGALRVVKGGALLPAPFARLTVDSAGERGLLGVAFHPSFATNGFVFVYHTVPGSPPRNRVSRFTADGDVARAGSRVTILDLDPLGRTNHNGGALHFGPDGKLYVAVGENGERANAQSLANRHGKILRLNPDGTIPADNPSTFPGIAGSTAGANRAIWAVGLRNPYTFAFQRHAGTMFINDVGGQTWEEVNRGLRGRNYGWPTSEGPTDIAGLTGPAYAYQHQSGSPTGCAISGGAFYNPQTREFPEGYVGRYFFADFCGNWIHHLDPASPGTATLFHSGLDKPVDLAVGAGGALLYVQRGNGQLRRVRYTGQSVQAIVASATRVQVAEGGQASVTLRLAIQPATTRDVTVQRYLSDPSVTASPATLRFTPDNWDTGQRVAIAARHDTDRSDDGATLRAASPGLATADIRVTAQDDERPAGAPRAVLAEPQNGATVSGRNAEFFGDGVPSGSGGAAAVRAAFVVDGAVRHVDTNGSGHYHLGGAHNLWDTTRLPNGEHLLTLRVYDAQGRWGAHTVRVNVRN